MPLPLWAKFVFCYHCNETWHEILSLVTVLLFLLTSLWLVSSHLPLSHFATLAIHSGVGIVGYAREKSILCRNTNKYLCYFIVKLSGTARRVQTALNIIPVSKKTDILPNHLGFVCSLCVMYFRRGWSVSDGAGRLGDVQSHSHCHCVLPEWCRVHWEGSGAGC